MTGESIVQIPLDCIKSDGRHRKDFGNIDALASSIEQLGLLQPIGVTASHNLVFGHRRILAFQKLGRTTIPARVIDVPAIVLAEHAENEIRKDFTVSERVAIGQAVEAELGKRQGQRTDLAPEGQGTLLGELPQNFAEVAGKESREIAAEKAGFGNKETYRQAKTVVERAAPELVAAVDRGTVAVSTAARLTAAPVSVQQQAAADPRKAIELAKAASATKVKEIQQNAKDEKHSHRAQGTGENEWYMADEEWERYELDRLERENYEANRAAFHSALNNLLTGSVIVMNSADRDNPTKWKGTWTAFYNRYQISIQSARERLDTLQSHIPFVLELLESMRDE